MNIKTFVKMGYAEGTSALLLFFIAMPLKYAFDMPAAVKYVGWLHGLLFVVYGLMIAIYGLNYKWKFSTMLLLFISSIIPGGPLFAESKILNREKKG